MEELRKGIEELNRQQRESTGRLRDPRGLRRGGCTGSLRSPVQLPSSRLCHIDPLGFLDPSTPSLHCRSAMGVCLQAVPSGNRLQDYWNRAYGQKIGPAARRTAKPMWLIGPWG